MQTKIVDCWNTILVFLYTSSGTQVLIILSNVFQIVRTTWYIMLCFGIATGKSLLLYSKSTAIGPLFFRSHLSKKVSHRGPIAVDFEYRPPQNLGSLVKNWSVHHLNCGHSANCIYKDLSRHRGRTNQCETYS